MSSITIRNIPDSLLKKIKTLAHLEKRSMNNEFIVTLEKGLAKNNTTLEEKHIPMETQILIWKNLSWEDDRSTKEIIDDIRKHRTPGRKIKL